MRELSYSGDISQHGYKGQKYYFLCRLGRLLTGGARGPGVFFIIPCVDIYEKIDLRTATYEIPPQEVKIILKRYLLYS